MNVEVLLLKSSLVTDPASQTSLASENVDPHHISEGLAMYRRTLEGDKDNPLDPPSRANVSGPSSKRTTLHQPVTFSIF